MRVENLKRANKAARELSTLDNNIKVCRQMIDSKAPALIQEHPDGSGLAMEYMYCANGKFSIGVYQEILEAALSILARARAELEMEIEEL